MTAKMIRFDDEYASKIEELVASSNGHIEVINDPMLQMDPYFYERKKQIAQTIEDIDSGKMKMYDFDESMDELISELES
ncbi:MAG: hypothetical protein U9N59_03655 [Campylobacterota bacterium]|nr:hypothetical protein [Campylobacterota bacterium]